MTIKSTITIAGTSFEEPLSMRVVRAMGDNNSTSNFTAIFDNRFGLHDDDFTVGKEVIIKADQDADPTTIIFIGLLETIKFLGKETQQRVELRGRGYEARLQDVTVEPSVFTNSEVSTIVQNIMDEFVVDITTTNINVTETTLSRIVFNHVTVYEALKQLAELSGFIFFVDINKDLNFIRKGSTSSGETLNNTNIISGRFNETRQGMANRVWVYGDRMLAGRREILEADGGSVFTLISKPRNTAVEFLGSIQKGGVFELIGTTVSGPDYLVSFHDRQLFFVSGTEVGYDSIPTSGGSIVVDYQREVPIIKFGEVRASIDLFGPRTLIIDDKSINDPQTAKDIVLATLEDRSNPFKNIEFSLQGWFTFNPGDTIIATLANFGLNENQITIININYFFDKRKAESEQVIKVTVDRNIPEITDELAELRRRLAIIEGGNRLDTDVISRLETAVGSATVVGSYFEIRTRGLGSSWVVGHPVFGEVGSDIINTQNFVGDSRGALSVQTSGGFDYSTL